MGAISTSTILAHLLASKDDGDVNAQVFFKLAFLADAVDGLFHSRHDAEITLEQMAERLGMTALKVRRLEGDTTGSMTLHRYADIALAYGMAPMLTLVPLEQARQQVIESLREEGSSEQDTLPART